MSDRRLGRREALERLARGVGAAALGPAIGCAGGPPVPAGTVAVDLRKVPPGAATAVLAGDLPVLVLNLDGRVRALSGRCTHEGCELGWNPRQRLIRCPCHGSAFFPDGTVKQGPARLPLRVFPTDVRGHVLLVRVGG